MFACVSVCQRAHYVFAYVCQSVRLLCESRIMSDQLQSNRHIITVWGRKQVWQWIDSLSFHPLLPLLLLFNRPLYLCSFHPPPLVFPHHLLLHCLLPPFFVLSQWRISHWPLLVIWSSYKHFMHCIPLLSSPLSRSIKLYPFPHWLHKVYKIKVLPVCKCADIWEKLFLQSALGAVENTRAPGPPLPADVGSWDAIGGAC